jgi:hypothetical protein
MASLSILAALALAGCGISEDEARDECNAIRDSAPPSDRGCMDDAAVEECVACKLDCDIACGTVDTSCPYRSVCSE